MKIKLLFALLFASVFSFTFFVESARAAGLPDPHDLGQVQPEVRLHFGVAMPEVAKPYLDQMSLAQFMEVKKDGQPFFAIVSKMPKNTSDVVSATSVFCYSINQSPTFVDVYLEGVVGVYLYKVDPQDKSKQKVDRIYYDDSVPCMEKFRQQKDK